MARLLDRVRRWLTDKLDPPTPAGETHIITVVIPPEQCARLREILEARAEPPQAIIDLLREAEKGNP
jgi:hypothetical protein